MYVSRAFPYATSAITPNDNGDSGKMQVLRLKLETPSGLAAGWGVYILILYTFEYLSIGAKNEKRPQV